MGGASGTMLLLALSPLFCRAAHLPARAMRRGAHQRRASPLDCLTYSVPPFPCLPCIVASWTSCSVSLALPPTRSLCSGVPFCPPSSASNDQSVHLFIPSSIVRRAVTHDHVSVTFVLLLLLVHVLPGFSRFHTSLFASYSLCPSPEACAHHCSLGRMALSCNIADVS